MVFVPLSGTRQNRSRELHVRPPGEIHQKPQGTVRGIARGPRRNHDGLRQGPGDPGRLQIQHGHGHQRHRPSEHRNVRRPRDRPGRLQKGAGGVPEDEDGRRGAEFGLADRGTGGRQVDCARGIVDELGEVPGFHGADFGRREGALQGFEDKR